jgi:hypothetical protein
MQGHAQAVPQLQVRVPLGAEGVRLAASHAVRAQKPRDRLFHPAAVVGQQGLRNRQDMAVVVLSCTACGGKRIETYPDWTVGR